MQTPQLSSTEMQASTSSDIHMAGPECLSVTHSHPNETYNLSSSCASTPAIATSPSTISSIYSLYNPEDDLSKPYDISADLDMIALLHNTPSATCSPPAPSPCHTPAIDPTPRPGPMFKILLGQDQLDLAYIPISRRLVAPSCVSPVKSASTSASPSTRRKAQQYPNKGSNPRTTISISSANPKKSRHLRQLTPLGAKVAGAKRKAVDSQPFPTDPRKKEDAYERFKKQRTMSDVNGKETARKAVVGVQTAYKKGVVLSSTAREPEMDLYKQFTNDLGYDPSTLLSWTSS